MNKENGCFLKPLSFRVVCYAARSTWCRYTWRITVGPNLCSGLARSCLPPRFHPLGLLLPIQSWGEALVGLALSPQPWAGPAPPTPQVHSQPFPGPKALTWDGDGVMLASWPLRPVGRRCGPAQGELGRPWRSLLWRSRLRAQGLLALWGEPLLGGAPRSWGLRRLSWARAPYREKKMIPFKFF